MASPNRSQLIAGAAIAIATALAAAQGFAQTQGSGDEAAAAAEPPADTIIVPRLTDTTPPGHPGSKSPGDINWPDVRNSVGEMRKRDEAYERQMRAMSLSRDVSQEEQEKLRPKGLRSMTPGQLQSESVSAEEVAKTRVPLLVPVTAETVGTMRVIARENAYTAVGDLAGGASFEIAGTRMRVVVGDAGVAKMRMAQRKQFAAARIEGLDAPFVISHHEQGVDLSFSKFNCAYMITVYCPKPDSDSRCSQDDFVTSLASSIAILNESEGATP